MAVGDLHKRLNPHIKLTPEAVELRAWLIKNQENFLKVIRNEETGEDEPLWQTWEIAKYAKFNGFSDKTVYDQISHVGYAVRGAHIEHGAAMNLYLFEETCEDVKKMQAKMDYVKELDISLQWKAYIAYAVNGIEFEDLPQEVA